MNKIIEGLVCINIDDKDYCKLSDLTSDWKKILSDYTASHYLRCIKYDVHHSYFIAIDDVDDDTISMLNKAGITIYQIDYIVDSISIRFKDEASREIVFNVLKGEVE